MSKKNISSHRVSKFVIANGKKAQGFGISPYSVASEILTSMGHHKPPGIVRPKAHCLVFAEIIWGATPLAPKPSKGTPTDADYAIVAERLRQRAKKAPVTVKQYASGVDVTTDEFLSTYEWRRVRIMALKKHGPVCQCCGASPMTGAVINVDHIKPRKLFPQLALSVENLQILCHECNHGKGNWDMTDWREGTQPNEVPLDEQQAAHMRAI